jgi:hypothetical protein
MTPPITLRHCLADHAIGKLGAVKLKGSDGPAGAEGPGRL